jgi:predicted dehydrogenase
VIGLGYWGPNLVRNVAASPHTELAAICDRDPERLATLGRQYPAARQVKEVGELFTSDDIDGVCIATPVSTHYPLAKQALEHGKHVLVEKPFVQRVDQAEELVALARERGRVLMVDHVFLFAPAVQRLARAVNEGELGDLQYVDSVRINLGLVQQDVNVLWDLAVHDLSIIDYLVGRNAKSVVAFGEAHQGHGLADVAYLHVDYGDGLIASVHANWLSPVKVRHFIVGGTKKSALYNELNAAERLKIYDYGVDTTRDPESKRRIMIAYRTGDVLAPKLEPIEPLRAMIEHFAACCRDGTTPLSSGEQGVRVVRVLAAAEESLAKGGAPIDLEAYTA